MNGSIQMSFAKILGMHTYVHDCTEASAFIVSSACLCLLWCVGIHFTLKLLWITHEKMWTLVFNPYNWHIPSVVIKWICLPIHTHTSPSGIYKWPSEITRLSAYIPLGARCIIWWFTNYFMVIHDTWCPYWDQVALNNTKL